LEKIKFSHVYYKFPKKPPFQATLLQCLAVNYKELSKDFIEYDTVFTGGHYYPLPKTDLIILVLGILNKRTWVMQIFTTIRRYTPRKWEFYKGLEGKQVQIVYNNKGLEEATYGERVFEK